MDALLIPYVLMIDASSHLSTCLRMIDVETKPELGYLKFDDAEYSQEDTELFLSKLFGTDQDGWKDAIGKAAIKRIVDKGFIHNDVEWRHVGLLPVFGPDGKLVDLAPILIDVGDVRAVKEEEKKTAMTTMMNRLFPKSTS
jgi:hypothetical protein